MKIAVWKTGHPIADTVADALFRGIRISNPDPTCIFNTQNYFIDSYDCRMAYGILRGTTEVFRESDASDKPWFHLDRGYTNPGHFDGNYRISYKGTQAIWHEGAPRKPIDINLEPQRFSGKRVMICPPSQDVCEFFGIDYTTWTYWAGYKASSFFVPCFTRHKGETEPIEWDEIRAVITFNSSVGWEAVRRGIPCLSDVNHSTVGSFYGETVTENLFEKFYILDRMKLFEFMSAHQFTLEEIRWGDAWGLIQYYLSRYSSGGMPGKPWRAMSLPTQFAGAQEPS